MDINCLRNPALPLISRWALNRVTLGHLTFLRFSLLLSIMGIAPTLCGRGGFTCVVRVTVCDTWCATTTTPIPVLVFIDRRGALGGCFLNYGRNMFGVERGRGHPCGRYECKGISKKVFSDEQKSVARLELRRCMEWVGLMKFTKRVCKGSCLSGWTEWKDLRRF